MPGRPEGPPKSALPNELTVRSIAGRGKNSSWGTQGQLAGRMVEGQVTYFQEPQQTFRVSRI